MKNKGMTYSSTGVNYDLMDPFKREAQALARETSFSLLRCGYSEIEASRGESVYLYEADDHILAHVEEGLGTKNLVADAMYELTGKNYYANIAQDTVAMIVNDLITSGACPQSIAMHLAAGSSDWFEDGVRTSALNLGWKIACMMARCSWGGGETPTLKGIVNPKTFVLSGSATGIIKPKNRMIRGNIQNHDAILLFKSSGIHANGLTLARSIAERKDTFWRSLGHDLFPNRVESCELPEGYLTKIHGEITYGEALLQPTVIYVPLVEDCLNAGTEIHYAVNITGHGWRKLMRAKGEWDYVITGIPEPQPVFRFIQHHGPVDDREAYANLNMGAGFALYVPEKETQKVLTIAKSLGYEGMCAGHISKRGIGSRVVIMPLHLYYLEEELDIR